MLYVNLKGFLSLFLSQVLITIYWLGRKAQADPSYSGPQLNFKAFEGLLGVALSKVSKDRRLTSPVAAGISVIRHVLLQISVTDIL